ncbi:hypothetical protein [Desulfosporosinus fructosivorans]
MANRHSAKGVSISIPSIAIISSKHSSPGYVSLLILLILTILSGVGMEGYLKANAESRMVRRDSQSRQAQYLSEGGIEWAKAQLLVDSGLRQGSLSLVTGRVVIVIESSGGGYKVISEGHSGLAVRKIEEIIQLDAGKWVLKSYQELHT